MKFGGSSLKDSKTIKEVKNIIHSSLKEKPIIVLSAIKGVTNLLIKSIDESHKGTFTSYNKIIKIHRKIITGLKLDEDIIIPELEELKKALDKLKNRKECSKRTSDYVYFFGERLSVKIVAEYFNKCNIKSEPFVSGDIGLLTDSQYGNAHVLPISYKKINRKLKGINVIPIITGFGGKDKKGNYTTLARGGSDYVASIIGAALKAKEIQIWTDTDGIMTADPRIVEDAITINEINFEEASEMAYFGAKVLHPKTIYPAIEKNVPVKVLSTFNPKNKGTIIGNKIRNHEEVSSISYKKDVNVINFSSINMIYSYGYLSNIFRIFKKYKTSIDMISTSEANVSMTLDSSHNLNQIVNELKNLGDVTVHKNYGIIYIIGEGVKKDKLGIISRISCALVGFNIKMVSHCFDGIGIGFLVDTKDVEKCINLLHREFIR